MNRIVKIISSCLVVCVAVACSPKSIEDIDVLPIGNESIDSFDNQYNNGSQEPILSEIWKSNNIPTTFDELKPYLLDGCWVYIKQNNQSYTQVDIIAFTDFPVMVENEYYQLGNDDYLYANVISDDFIDDTTYDRYEKYKNVEMNYPSIPIKHDEKYFDKHYYYYNFTYENNESLNNNNINICFTRYDEHIEWYLTMDNFDIDNREITFKGKMKYKHYSGDITNGPWEEVIEIEDNECTFKHFTSIKDAEEYIYKVYIEPMKPLS